MTEQERDVEEIVVEEKTPIAEDIVPDSGENPLLSALLQSSDAAEAALAIQEPGQNPEQDNVDTERKPLIESYTVEGQEYLVPTFDPNAEDVDLVVRKARKSDGSMVTPEERENAIS